MRQDRRSGAFLLICMALVASMVALAFAYVLSMRAAASVGPSTTAVYLAQQSARAGTTHAMEVLVRDYLEMPRVPTSDASPHRTFFDPIDNATPSSPRDPVAASSTEAQVWNDNDASPAAKNLNPYRPFTAHIGRSYDLLFDNRWLGNFSVSSTPRYIEPMYYSLDPGMESGVGKTDFTVVPGSARGVSAPVYYDSRWQPAATRAEARYRLRYAVMCEDLSGHLLSGLPAEFQRGDPLAVDGDLIATAKNSQGLEFDHAWAKRYAPQVNPMYTRMFHTGQRGILGEGGGIQTFGLLWNGSGGGGIEHSLTQGFDAAGVMRSSSPWAYRTSSAYVGAEIPAKVEHPMGVGWSNAGAISWRIQGKHYSWQSMRTQTYDYTDLTTGGLLTPYQAPSRWDRNPDPESVDVETLAYNEGPTDVPWRINVLTAPVNAIQASLSGFRASRLWDYRLLWKLTIGWAGAPTNAWRSGDLTNGSAANPSTYAIPPVALAPERASNLQIPDAFRHTFATKDRLTGMVDRFPFAQFIVSPSAKNPRCMTGMPYPGPGSGYAEELGSFSDLFVDANQLFGAGTGRAIGACCPRYDYAPRITLMSVFGSFGQSTVSEVTGYVIPGPLQEICYGFYPYVKSGSIWYLQNPSSQTPTNLVHARSLWFDSSTALASSVGAAIAAHQRGTSFPAAPPKGGDAMFSGRWGNPTPDADVNGDGYKESSSAFTNVGDLDRLFLLILGEDPDAPGRNPGTREALYAAMAGSGAHFWDKPYVPRLCALPEYDPAKVEYSTALEPTVAPYTWTQNPYGQTLASQINLRRSSLRGLRDGLYTTPVVGPNSARHQADTNRLKSEAATFVKATPAYPDPMTKAKHRQLMRCRLRDAERLINDMRMSYFGANVAYRDRTRTGHASRGRFRPYDLDGDGWAICSAYCPSAVVPAAVWNPSASNYPYRFAEPSDWSKVIYDASPDDASAVDGVNAPTDTTGPVWVCFKDVDPAAAGLTLTNDPATSDFTDFLTYTTDDDIDNMASGRPGEYRRAFPAGCFGIAPASRAGYTRWFYPAVRVQAYAGADIADGVAHFPPDTYFSISGCYTLEKSHFYRMIVRGEVWDEWRRTVLSTSLLESVFMLDPDGDVIRKSAAKPTPVDPGTGRVSDASGLEDTGIIYQRWLRDLNGGTRNRAAAAK